MTAEYMSHMFMGLEVRLEKTVNPCVVQIINNGGAIWAFFQKKGNEAIPATFLYLYSKPPYVIY